MRLLCTTGVSWYVVVEFYLDHQQGALCGSCSYIISNIMVDVDGAADTETYVDRILA